MNLANVFAGFQRIYGVCPCCGEVFRLSEAQLFISTPPPRTLFDELELSRMRRDGAFERFELNEERIREQSRKRGQEAARHRLSAIAPFFSSRSIDPNDVKVLFDPVLYLAFQGLNAGACTRVLFIDSVPRSEAQRRFHASLASALRRGNVEWRTFNVKDDGCITCI